MKLPPTGLPYKGTYCGPLSYLHGKTALLRDTTLAQFDDPGLYMAYGWHPFKPEDFRVPETAPLYQALSIILESRRNCFEKMGNSHNPDDYMRWFETWTERAENLVKNYMPSGSGFDTGTRIDLDESVSRLVFTTSYHHMDEGGGYDGWTEHQVIATPSLAHGFELRVTGRNRNSIKDYITEVFNSALSQEVAKYGND